MKNFNVLSCGLLVLAAAFLLSNNVSYRLDTQPKILLADGSMSEGELREMYYGADRKIMQCAGSGQCDNEDVENLKVKRSAAQDGLSIHHNYKYVGGEFIKKPRE